MKPTVHKLLRHSCEIARKFRLPMAYYSEDANESWHKLCRKFMVSHFRQTSRQKRLLDVFNRAVYLTDPKISLIYLKNRLKLHKMIPVSSDILEFILDGYENNEACTICSVLMISTSYIFYSSKIRMYWPEGS